MMAMLEAFRSWAVLLDQVSDRISPAKSELKMLKGELPRFDHPTSGITSQHQVISFVSPGVFSPP
jgi:hypothetical protein